MTVLTSRSGLLIKPRQKASLSSLAKIVHILEISLDAIVLGSVSDNVFASYLQLFELLADCTDSERKTIIDAAVKYKLYLRSDYSRTARPPVAL